MSVEVPVTVIAPSKGWVSLRLGALWRYRELLYFLIWRDIKVRYKQTALGAAWAIIQPLLHDGGLQHLLRQARADAIGRRAVSALRFAALVPWTFFANGLTQSSNSLVGNQTCCARSTSRGSSIPIAAVLVGAGRFRASRSSSCSA